MSSFDFVGSSLPTVHADCIKAESHLSADPVAACFSSRGWPRMVGPPAIRPGSTVMQSIVMSASPGAVLGGRGSLFPHARVKGSDR